MPASIDRYDEIAPIEAEWDELALRLDSPPPLRPGCIAAWWGSFGEGQLQILALRREGDLAGVLPIVRKGRIVESPTNWHTDVFGPVAEDEEARRALFAAVFEDKPRRVDLGFLDREGTDLDAFAQVAGRYGVTSRLIMRSPYVPIESDWQTYWQQRSKNLRKSVRRSENRLAQLGKVSMEVSDGAKDLDGLLEEGFAVEASGWKGERGTAINSTPETLRFYRQIAYWGVETGMLRLAFLRVGEKPVAFHFSLETEDRHYVWKLGHDADLDPLGPGRVLIARTIERAFEHGFKSYEFLGSLDEYKLRWASSARDLLRAQAFAPSVPGRFDRLAQIQGRALAKKVLRRSGPASGGEQAPQ